MAITVDVAVDFGGDVGGGRGVAVEIAAGVGSGVGARERGGAVGEESTVTEDVALGLSVAGAETGVSTLVGEGVADPLEQAANVIAESQ